MLPIVDLSGSTISGNVEMLNADPAQELPVVGFARVRSGIRQNSQSI